MTRLRRATALFVNLLLAQLLLVGAGTPCADRASMGADHGAAQGAMSAERMASGHDAGVRGTQCSDCTATHGGHAPCDMPSSAPGGGSSCQQMSTCAAPMIVQPPAPLVAALDAARAAVASATVPPGTTSAPDVPPPRA